MNELDRLRGAHAAVPGPADGAVARGREKLEAALRTRPRRRGRPVRLALVAAALAAAVVAAVALAPSDSPRRAPRPSSAEAACRHAGPAGDCLRAIGGVAAQQPAPPRDGVLYIRNDFTMVSNRFGPDRGQPAARWHTLPGATHVFMFVRSVPEELWLAPDGAARIAYGDEGPPRPASALDERAWREAGSPDLDRFFAGGGEWGPKVQTFGPGDSDELLLGNGELDEVLPDDWATSLPRDPAKLRDALMRLAFEQRTRVSGDGPCAALDDCDPAVLRNIRSQFGSDITTLLRHPLAPPDLRRALFEVFAGLDGTRLLGSVRDSLGRRGVGLYLPEGVNDGQNVVVFDPGDGRLVAVGMADEPDVDAVRWQSLDRVETATVARIGERP